MSDKRVVITGVGVIAPNGIGKESFWQGLKAGRSGVRSITAFDPGLFKTHLAGEVVDFEAESILGTKDLKNIDRSTKFLWAASKQALEDAGLEINKDNAVKIGLVTATTISVVWNIAEFSKEIVQDGPQYVNPAIFPGTTINAPSSQVSIRLGIKGFNSTISTGFTASLDALKYAVDFLKRERAEAILVAGVESLVFQSFAGFYKMDFLAGIKGEEVSCPFDKRRNGIILGEGAGVVVIEEEAHARTRNARVYAEVKSVEGAFDTYRSGKYHPYAKGLKISMTNALQEASLQKKDIDCISASANSVVLQDRLETIAIKEVFGDCAAKIPVSAIKSMLGESLSAGGMFQLIASVGSFQQDFIPPTINYALKDEECDLDYVTEGQRNSTPKNILINNFGPGGSNASAVLSRY